MALAKSKSTGNILNYKRQMIRENSKLQITILSKMERNQIINSERKSCNKGRRNIRIRDIKSVQLTSSLKLNEHSKYVIAANSDTKGKIEFLKANRNKQSF